MNKTEVSIISYHEAAEQINKDLINLNKIKDKEIINAILRFGQTAKFRCRSNIAYDNFAKLCFHDITELERIQPEGLDFEILRVKE